MSTKTSKTSEQVDELSSAPSVLDFLYHDNRRIGSFLSQFEGDGHLQQFTRTKQGQKAKKETSSQDIKGNAGIASGKIQGGTETAYEMNEGYVRVFDPYWANARAFLDYLSENDLIQEDLDQARIGQIVLVRGSLIISDLKMLQSLWELPSIRNSIIKSVQEAVKEDAVEEQVVPQNRQQRRKTGPQNKNQPKTEIPDELAITMEVLPHMPHGGQMHLISGDKPVWAPISDGCLVSPISELILKHGPKIAGQWSAVGILDALPWEAEAELTLLERVQIGMLGESISNLALNLSSPIRQILGRPLLSYGLTPLLVFREVS